MRIEVDYLVMGSGVAGLFFAIQAAERGRVALVTKRDRRESNTRYAQGGIAAVMDAHDSVASHVRDTELSGAGLCRPSVVESVIAEGPDVVTDLVKLGARFTRDASGALSLAREGGHERARVVRADDMTGREVARTLVAAAERQPNLLLLDEHMAVDLLLDRDGQCCGAQVINGMTGECGQVYAGATLLATGGCGRAFLHTTNPPIANGDGLAMAWRAGAQVGNMEFVQFHPTMFFDPGGPAFLITEALRGHGALLVSGAGRTFVDPLSTRDIVSRAIVRHMQTSGEPCAYLDATDSDGQETKARFPNIYRYCLERGFDITQQRLPVVPAAHYSCGGVCTDEFGQTTVPGLYAAGEVAMSGFHGANRLASNSLLEGLVFARRAFRHMGLPQRRTQPSARLPSGPPCDATALDALVQQVRRLMWDEVGIERSDAGLTRACGQLDALCREIEELYERHGAHAEMVQLRNVATVADLIARSARWRLESRGCHYNTDHAECDDVDWRCETLLTYGGGLARGCKL
jgi:L-aspartate oxidase